MPDTPQSKLHPHPHKQPPRGIAASDAGSLGRYAELDVTSNFTFLTGGSHPEELVQRAAQLGHAAIAITDTNTLAGIVRAHTAAKDAGIRLIVGCRLVLEQPQGLELLVYPTCRDAYARLCRMLTIGKRRAEKGHCSLTLDDVVEHNAGMLGVIVPPASLAAIDAAYLERVRTLRRVFDSDRLSLTISIGYGPDDRERCAAIAASAAACRVPLVATNRVLYHAADRRPLQDVLTCIRLGTTVDAAGYALLANAERHMKPASEMARLFAEYPLAIARTVEIAERAGGVGGVDGVGGFSLDELRYEYPHEVTPPGITPMRHLRDLASAGAKARYPEGTLAKVQGIIDHELELIEELKYAPYFLTVHDLVTFARSRGILCQGRGAAANSAVCYCLGITSVDPSRGELLFERFISRERNEPPDIDIDFEHERREEVLQYIYAKYGRERAALTAEVISYRGKSAVRDVGKAMGLSLDCINQLSRTLDWWDTGGVNAARLRELGLNPEDRTLRLVMHLCGQLLGFPRHLSQHVGGFVITNSPLCELVPIENAAMQDRTVIEWDKDDIDAMGMLKVDCLGLGMLTCIRKCFDLIRRHHGRDLTLATVPAEDSAVYDMICNADTIGVFQIESRAQMAMLPRLRPRCFYDLVIEVAIVRPGPIQGKMVHPYIRRRNGEEQATYPNNAVREVLGRTLGVPLFQEQAMKLAIVAAGFTAGEADQLRRAMAAWRRKGDLIYRFGEKLIAGMLANGFDQEFAERCFEQIKGFSEYGFPESHAASFALLVYVSSWQKCHYPAAFAAALINSQPMGFYQPAQIVRDAQNHGVEVRAVDINHSAWDCTLEDGGRALRLGMRMVRAMSQPHADAIVRERECTGPFASVHDLHRRCRMPVAALRRLARADAMGSLGLDRQRALWALQAVHDEELPVIGDAPGPDDRAASLPVVPPAQQVRHDYASIGLSLKAHPVSFLRDRLDAMGVSCAREIQCEQASPSGRPVQVAGVVLVRQRPGTASGILFMTIEDETGIANLIVRPKVFERYRSAARHSTFIRATGKVERNGPVVHVQVARIDALDPEQDSLFVRSRDFH
jgi:error-prone DNA polymerase